VLKFGYCYLYGAAIKSFILIEKYLWTLKICTCLPVCDRENSVQMRQMPFLLHRLHNGPEMLMRLSSLMCENKDIKKRIIYYKNMLLSSIEMFLFC